MLILLMAFVTWGCGEQPEAKDDPAIEDGTYFGFVTEIGEDYLLVDLAEAFWDQEEAQEAALADGVIDTAEDLAEPFYIHNADETPVRLEVDLGARFTIVVDPSANTNKNLTREELASLAAGESDGTQYYAGLPGQPGPTGLPMDLTISAGAVTGGYQHYLP